MSLFIRRLAVACTLLASGTVIAGTATNSFQVTATVISSCLVSGSTLNFGGSIDPLTSAVPVDGTSALSIQCTNTTPYSVALNAGVNATGASNFSGRAMKSGSNSLAYQLYTDAARSTVWGDGTASSTTNGGTGTGLTQSMNIYGRIPSLTGAVPGGYTDTVTITVTY